MNYRETSRRFIIQIFSFEGEQWIILLQCQCSILLFVERFLEAASFGQGSSERRSVVKLESVF
jgi:hypothetical protein